MDRESIAQKVLFFLLNLLLITGAITCVLTIDRGRWLIENPAFYQPPEVTLEAPQRVVEPIIPNTGVEPAHQAVP